MIDGSSIVPQKSYVQRGDIATTDVRDKGIGKMLGLDNYRGNALQCCLGFGKNVLNIGKALTKPLVSLAKMAFNPVGTVLNKILNGVDAHERQKLSPPFKDADDLSVPELKKLGREAKICGGSTPEHCVTLGVLPKSPEKPTEPVPLDQYIDDFKAKMNIETLSEFELEQVTKTHSNFVNKYNENLRSYNEKMELYAQKLEAYEKSPEKTLLNRLPEKLRANIEKHDGMFIDKNTGLAMSLVWDKTMGENGKPTIHLQFHGTGAGSDKEGGWVMAEHISTDIAMSGVTIGMPSNFKQGSEIAQLIKQGLGKDFNIECKGHSMGGALATYIGIKNDMKVVTTSTAPLSPQLQKDLGYDAMREAVEKNRITHLCVKGDWLTDNSKLSKALAKGFELGTGKQISHIIGGGVRINQEFPGLGLKYGGKFADILLNIGAQMVKKTHAKAGEAMEIHNSVTRIWDAYVEQRQGPPITEITGL